MPQFVNSARLQLSHNNKKWPHPIHPLWQLLDRCLWRFQWKHKRKYERHGRHQSRQCHLTCDAYRGYCHFLPAFSHASTAGSPPIHEPKSRQSAWKWNHVCKWERFHFASATRNPTRIERHRIFERQFCIGESFSIGRSRNCLFLFK